MCNHTEKENEKENLSEKIQSLSVGDTFKNYKALCQVLGLSVKTGNAKIYQLKEVERYIKLEHVKQSYTITEIYDNPLPKIEKRGGNRTVYLPFTKQILSSYFMSLYCSREKYYIDLTKNELYRILGLTNQFYAALLNGKVNTKDLYNQNKKKIPTFVLNNFIFETRNKLNSVLSSCLNSLVKEDLITVDKIYYGRKSAYNNKDIYHELTDEEIEKVKRIRDQALLQMRTSEDTEPPTLYYLITHRLYDRYKMLVAEKIRSELDYLWTFEKQYINFTGVLDEAVIDDTNVYLTDKEMEEKKKELNTLMIDFFAKRFSKIVLSDRTIKTRNKKYYNDCYKSLIKYFIDIRFGTGEEIEEYNVETGDIEKDIEDGLSEAEESQDDEWWNIQTKETEEVDDLLMEFYGENKNDGWG